MKTVKTEKYTTEEILKILETMPQEVTSTQKKDAYDPIAMMRGAQSALMMGMTSYGISAVFFFLAVAVKVKKAGRKLFRTAIVIGILALLIGFLCWKTGNAR